MKAIIVFIFCLLLFSGCKKETIDSTSIKMMLPTNGAIYSVHAISNDSIIICGANADTGFVFLSNDGGFTWQQPCSGFWNPVFDVSTISNVWWASSKYINYFRSNNYGHNYVLSIPNNTQMPTGAYDAAVYDIVALDSITALACGGKNFQEGFIYRTPDGGINWHLMQTSHEMRQIANYANDAVAVGYGAIYYSYNAGNSWQLVNAPADFFTGVVYANGWVACGFDGGIYTSKNGISWYTAQQNNALLGKRKHYNAIHFNAQTGMAVGTNGLVSISQNWGETWQQASINLNDTFNDVIVLNANKAIIVGDNGAAYFINF
jgi:photosystem II stability/assembly factor-like uncharacterized protein